MSPFEDFYELVKEAVQAAWSDVDAASGGGGVIRAERIMRKPFNEQTILPLAVIHIPRHPTTPDGGMANLTFAPDVEIYRVQPRPEDIAGLEEKLWVLMNYLWTTNPAPVPNIRPERSFSTSPFVSPVARELSKQLQFSVGCYTQRFMFGVRGPGR